MPLPLILQLLMPLITHLIDHLMAKDTSAMSVEETEEHKNNLECANGMCELAKKMKA